MPSSFNPGVGSGAPSLPVWTFDPAQTGTPPSGHFQTDNADPSMASTIYLSPFQKNGPTIDLSGYFNNITGSAVMAMQLTNLAGKSLIFSIGASGSPALPVAPVCIDSIALSGDYSISIIPFNFAGLPAPATPTISAVLGASGISPAGDGTVTPPTSITTQTGIVTSVS